MISDRPPEFLNQWPLMRHQFITTGKVALVESVYQSTCLTLMARTTSGIEVSGANNKVNVADFWPALLSIRVTYPSCATARYYG